MSFKKVWQQKLGRLDVHIPYHIFCSLEVNCCSPALKHTPLCLYILPLILGLVSGSLLTEKSLTQLSFWSDRAEDLDSLGTSRTLFEEPDTLPETETFFSLALNQASTSIRSLFLTCFFLLFDLVPRILCVTQKLAPIIMVYGLSIGHS